MLRRSCLTTAAVLIVGTLAPGLPATAGDPAAFIGNLGNQLEAAVNTASPE